MKKRKGLFFLLFPSIIIILCFSFSCGRRVDEDRGDDDLWSWDSASEEAAVTGLTLEAFELFPVDLDKLFYIDNPAEQERLKGNFFISPFSKHTQIGNHTEGRGKWYLSCDNQSPVYAPVRGIMTQGLNENLLAKTDSDLQTVSGESVYNNCAINFYFSKYTVVTFGHIGILASIKTSLENATDCYITIQKGELLGFGPMGAATLDFQVRDGRTNNGLSSVRYADINTWTCPMQYFTQELQTKIQNYYNTYIYSYYSNNEEAKVVPELKYDSPLNINVTDEVWGVWWYKSGLNDVPPNTPPHMQNMGIIALLSWEENKINHETFNPYLVNYPSFDKIQDFVGIYNDQYGFQVDLPFYELNYLYNMSGDKKNDGLFMMINSNDQTHYFRYKVYSYDLDTIWDNELHIGIGSTEAEAETAFNSSPIVYSIDAKTYMGNPRSPIEP